jgi:phytoene desaturase
MAPGLSEHVEADFYVTPRYFKETLLSTHGAGFGVQPILSQSAYFRFHARCPHYRNLYFVGAGTHPGAGLPGVLSTAKAMERAVIRDGFAREVAAS